MEFPADGTTVAGQSGTPFTYSGVLGSPNVPISLQVLDNPDGVATWVEFTRVTSSTTPNFYPSTYTVPYYGWTTSTAITLAAPANSTVGAERWPQGGLMRVRAVRTDSNQSLYFADENGVACASANSSQNWINIAAACARGGTLGAAIASTTSTPADALAAPHTTPPYLSKTHYAVPLNPGESPPAAESRNTTEYYQVINAPPTLAAFQQVNGFTDGTAKPISATYYNRGDLGIGRGMHCGSKNGTVACYVSNFAPRDAANNVIFGDQANSLALATTAGSTPFATVAMTYTPPASAPNSIKFIVYGGDGKLQANAKLDSKGVNTEVPGNCLTCHGALATYTPATHTLASSAAHFLPFDVVNSFSYGSSPFAYADQADAFHKLNTLVLQANPTAGILEYVAGLYPSGDSTTNPTFTPAGWTDNNSTHAKLYTSVVAPYCRTCHVAMGEATNSSVLDWTQFSNFQAFSGTIGAEVCAKGAHLMPHAEQTLKNFWTSAARAHLTGILGIAGSCNPI
jgi:hypothetical protein